MKTCILYMMLMIPLYSEAQSSILSIVKAENDFEKTCYQKGIKPGFLDNMDSTAVAFTDKGIVNAIQFWESLQNFPGYYSWAPSYAEVTADGNWGYTTGSVEFREKSPLDTPAYYSQYTTIWHKNKEGHWKYLVDIGNSHPAKKIDRTAEEVTVPKFGSAVKESEIADLENGFNRNAKTDGIAGIREYYGVHYILNLSGQFPNARKEDALKSLSPYLKEISYTFRGVKTAPSGEMAVSYGNVSYRGKSDYYIRVWRHEKNGWKIALEVIKI